MNFDVKRQESYSRGELLLRSFFGVIYIALPHAFVLMFLGIWGAILSFISWWVVLFTGRYPQSFFEYQVKLLRWRWRLNAVLYNLCDGYPPFGLDAEFEGTTFEVEYPESLSRGTLLLRLFFGVFYILIPHGFILYFRLLWTLILMFLSWWAVLFTGEYPTSWHEFNVGTLRWGMRVGLYWSFMTDEYPPFSGKP
jgi:hypothetical protein